MTAPGANVVLPHLRITWGGEIGAGEEIWSNSLAFKFSTGEAASVAELEAIAAAVRDYLPDLITPAAMRVSPAVALSWVKAVWILPTGKQRDVNTVISEWAGGARPVGGGTQVPWTQTYAVTLRTANQRGRGHSGRIFPPPSGPMPEGVTPYAPAAFATSQAAAYGAFINAAEAAITTVIDPGGAGGNSNGRSAKAAVVSRLTDDGRAPLLTEIITAVCDRVADVQHRRTNRVARSEGATFGPF